MQHTQGKWVADRHILGYGWRIFIQHEADADQHDAIADLETWQTDFETKANAHLIAAAPELLEACKALLQEAEYREKQGEPWGFSIDSARTAIARADGGE